MTRNTPGSEYLRGGKDPYPTQRRGLCLGRFSTDNFHLNLVHVVHFVHCAAIHFGTCSICFVHFLELVSAIQWMGVCFDPIRKGE